MPRAMGSTSKTIEERNRTVCELLDHGQSVFAIAEAFCLAPNTIRFIAGNRNGWVSQRKSYYTEEKQKPNVKLLPCRGATPQAYPLCRGLGCYHAKDFNCSSFDNYLNSISDPGVRLSAYKDATIRPHANGGGMRIR